MRFVSFGDIMEKKAILQLPRSRQLTFGDYLL
jgi:hypothetical protein